MTSIHDYKRGNQTQRNLRARANNSDAESRLHRAREPPSMRGAWPELSTPKKVYHGNHAKLRTASRGSRCHPAGCRPSRERLRAHGALRGLAGWPAKSWAATEFKITIPPAKSSETSVVPAQRKGLPKPPARQDVGIGTPRRTPAKSCPLRHR
jgi:hypothetical protein